MDDLTKTLYLGSGRRVEWASPQTVVALAMADLFSLEGPLIDWLVAAPTGSTVNADAFAENGENFIFADIRFKGSLGALFEAELSIQIAFGRLEGRTVARLDYVRSQPGGVGVGIRWFKTFVSRLTKANVDSIGLLAARGKNFNGYYTWPGWGFNIPFDDEVANKANLAGFSARSTHDLFLLYGEAGRNWWRENGVEAEAIFDLTPKSISIQILDAYCRNKGIEIE